MTSEPRVQIRVVHRFQASPEQVFDAWLDPDQLAKWMFGPPLREEEVLHIALDSRTGGPFSFLVRRNGEEIDHIGHYREIERPRHLTFTWGIAGESEDESVVKIDIVALESGSQLSLTHQLDPKWADYAERTKASWTKMLDSLDKNLATWFGFAR